MDAAFDLWCSTAHPLVMLAKVKEGVAGFWPGTETSSHSLGDLEHRIVCDGGRDKGCLPVCAIVLGADHHTPITEGIM